MKRLVLGVLFFALSGYAFANPDVYHVKKKYHFNNYPVLVNAIIIKPKSNYRIKLSYGRKFISTLERVKFFAEQEGAYAAINASFFKPDTGYPLGLSIINNRLITGPLLRRSVFGITKNGEYKIDKVNLIGKVEINNSVLKLNNINQPIMSTRGLYLFNSYWGKTTPCTDKAFSQIVVSRHKVQCVCKGSVKIPLNGYVLVGHNSLFKKFYKRGDKVKYDYSLHPKPWNSMKYAFAAGPFLVREGKRFIDEQGFSKLFLWGKAPRSAIGVKRDGSLILLTADGRQKGTSEGATLTELADIMLKFGAYDAMNLDGGSSTQMVLKNKLVNMPSNKVGARVTNAIVVVKHFGY